MSARSPGCSGCQPASDLVRSLKVGTSRPANVVANQPKCSVSTSGDFEMTGMFKRGPITSTIFLKETPPSATAPNSTTKLRGILTLDRAPPFVDS